MQIVRTVVWVLITAMLVAFMAMNWDRAPVNFWPLEDSYLRFEWPVGIIALFFFLLGLVPMWLLHRAGRWRLNRRISALENSVRATAAVANVTSTSAPESETQTETETGKTEDTAS